MELQQGYKELVLGRAAEKYIRERLQLGKTLSSHLLKTCDFSKGHITTCLPECVQDDTINRFDLSQNPDDAEKLRKGQSVTVQTVFSYISEITQDYLKNSLDKICLFEDPIAEAGDAWIMQKNPRILTFRDEIYHPAYGSDITEQIESAIWAADTWLFIGVMSNVDPETLSVDSFQNSQKIINNALRTIAERAEKVCIGAYDGESYLIWHNR